MKPIWNFVILEYNRYFTESLYKSRLLIALPVIQQLPLIIHPRLTHFLASQIEVNIHCYPTTPGPLWSHASITQYFKVSLKPPKSLRLFFESVVRISRNTFQVEPTFHNFSTLVTGCTNTGCLPSTTSVPVLDEATRNPFSGFPGHLGADGQRQVNFDRWSVYARLLAGDHWCRIPSPYWTLPPVSAKLWSWIYSRYREKKRNRRSLDFGTFAFYKQSSSSGLGGHLEERTMRSLQYKLLLGRLPPARYRHY